MGEPTPRVFSRSIPYPAGYLLKFGGHPLKHSFPAFGWRTVEQAH